MRIGLDARFLTHPQRGGFKTYTVNLINAIHRLDDENQYFIYLDRTTDMDKLPVKSNFNYSIVNGTLPVIGMPVREQMLLRRQISKDQLNVFHSLCNTAPIAPSVKNITTLHDTIQVTTKIRWMDEPGFKYWMIMAYSKWAIKSFINSLGTIITVSEFEKKQIAELFNLPMDRIAVTHLAANSIFKPANPKEMRVMGNEIEKKFGVSGDFILGVGFEDRKNIPLLIKAYKQIVSEFPDTNLVIVSAEEKKRQNFQQLVRELHLDRQVIVLGSVTATDLLGLYNLAKVFVFPSERESFGLPPLESIACGTPTVVMNSSSLPEILGEGALLIDGSDPKRWGETLRRILTDEKLQAEMIVRGLKRARELSWDNCARKTIQVYTQLVRDSVSD